MRVHGKLALVPVLVPVLAGGSASANALCRGCPLDTFYMLHTFSKSKHTLQMCSIEFAPTIACYLHVGWAFFFQVSILNQF